MSACRNVAANASNGIDEIFSYMCSLAVAKCSKKNEKKKASAGGAAMRKRLLIKNFVTQMLEQEKGQYNRDQLSREVNIPGHRSSNSNKHTKIPQTQIEEDTMDDPEEYELDVEETDELIEDQYQPLNDGRSTRRAGSLSDDEAEEDEPNSLDERLTIADTLNNNSSLSSTQRTSSTLLPGIGSLEMDSHRPFAPNPYLMNDNGLSLNDDGSTELDDDLVSENFELFPTKTSATTICPGSGKVPPSWQEPEADLFMLERSSPSLYYDEYSGTSVPVTASDSYGLTYCHDDFELSSTVSSASPYLISTCVVSDSTVVPSLSHALCGSNFEQPIQLPTNFMEEPANEQPSMTTLTTAVSSTLTTLTSTSGYDAELRLPVSKSTEEPIVHFDSMNRDSLFGGAEDNAKEEETKEKDMSVKELQESKIISTALVDLVNIVPSAISTKLGDCRREAFQDFSGSRHHITDLDTNEVQVTNLLPDIIDANGQARSPRKRISPLDYGSLMSMAALSPKRIKL